MPFNPTPEQSDASRRNLRGKEGPKTPEGKAKAAQNGQKNRGVKTAKARARVIDKRHGLNADTFYAAANCLGCKLECPAPSFTATTPHPSLPLGCLERVVRNDPRRCFYHLEGLCLADARDGAPVGSGPPCVVEPEFSADFSDPADRDPSFGPARELIFRKRTIRLIAEAKLYLSQLRRQGAENVHPHPRMVRVARALGTLLNRCGSCRYTPELSPFDWDELLARAVTGADLTGGQSAQTNGLPEAGITQRSLPLLPSPG